MKKLAKNLFLLLSVFLFSLPLMAKAKYLDSAILSKEVNSSIKSCGSPKTLQIPLITWGGDIATIYANGNQATTKSGSIFAQKGLKIKLQREDRFAKQMESYLSCRSPFLRGTMGMLNMAAPIANRSSKTRLVSIYQLTWSAGGDALVVKSGINTPKELRGKTIALQAFGPHVDYLAKILNDAGLSLSDVKIKWLRDLTGTNNSPMNAFYDQNVDAAMVIIPDGLALTSNGTIGTGAEDSVKGAKILLSTKTADHIISDVYAVRADYLEANRDKVERFVHGLMIAEEELKELFKNRSGKKSEYRKMIRSSAKILLDSPEAVSDTEGLYADARFVGWAGNVNFFANPDYRRSFSILNSEIQDAFISIGLMTQRVPQEHANWDYNKMKSGLNNTANVEVPKFNQTKVAQFVDRRQKQGNSEDGVLFSFEVYFKPNQNTFSASMYRAAFDKVIDLAATYGGAIITVEGHSDPLGYLKKRKKGATPVVLKRIRQAAKNLSYTRAASVRDSLINYAQTKNVVLDATQFSISGHGIMSPKNGMCGRVPCPPRTKQEWLNNMRVEFKIIQVEAEELQFEAL